MSTLIIAAILAGAVALVLRSMIRKRKRRKSGQCGLNCCNCTGSCH